MENKTKRGVFLNLNDSNIIYTTKSGIELRFTSNKKKDVYLHKLQDRLTQISILESKFKMLTGVLPDFVNDYLPAIQLKVYDEIIYK